jgi:prephenate dehydrogenase
VRVAIIGGSGKMGRWFADLLKKDGKEVVITGRNQSKLQEIKAELDVEVDNIEKAVATANAVIISVPIDSFEEVIKQVGLCYRPGQIIMDITSIKVLPVELLHKYLPEALALGMHPLFGPGAKGIRGQNFVLTPTNERERGLAHKVEQYLKERGASTALTNPQKHDEMMAVVLGLSHFVGLVSADTLLGLDRLEEMKAVGGTTYKLLLLLAESVVSENPEFYASLQMHLPKMIEIEEAFHHNARIWADLVKDENRQEFVRRMDGLKEKLEEADPDFKNAYGNMYRLLGG